MKCQRRDITSYDMKMVIIPQKIVTLLSVVTLVVK